MKRRPPLLIVLLLLVAGAIVNVAVAWGCAMWSGTSMEIVEIERPDLNDEYIAWWSVRFPERDPRPRKLTREESLNDVDPGYVLIEDAEVFGVRGRNMALLPWRQATSIWAGWPLEALTGEWRYRALWQQQPRTQEVNLIRADWLPQPELDVWGYCFDRFLPLRPLWPGFAINTVFYAVMLWLLFAAPSALRRRWRIRRGLCPKCAYDLRGGPPDGGACPECGSIVAS